MMMNAGFNLGSRDIETLNMKLGRIYRNPLIDPRNTALIGSTVTPINCLGCDTLKIDRQFRSRSPEGAPLKTRQNRLAFNHRCVAMDAA
jgi:hypothetical protein